MIQTSLWLLILLLSRCMISEKQSLKSDISSELSALSGTFAVVFHDLQSDQRIDINADHRFHAASTMKTPVLIELFRQADEGMISLDDSMTVYNTFTSIVDSSSYTLSAGDDSDSTLYELVGKQITLQELAVRMITVSSNLATNILIDIVKAGNVTATLRRLGMDSIQVFRGVEDIPAYRAGLNNTSTAGDLAIMFSLLGQGKAVSTSADAAMIEILERQTFREMIPRLLPPDVRVAHKTGWIQGVHHDSGLITLPNGRRYVLVLMSENVKDAEAVKTAFARISKIVYDHLH